MQINIEHRGIQYCAPEFNNFTDKQQITLSNTQNSDPYENAIAERINRTFFKTAEKMVSQAVKIYNNQRLHFSLELQTPENVHQIENVKYKSYKRKKILNLTQ